MSSIYKNYILLSSALIVLHAAVFAQQVTERNLLSRFTAQQVAASLLPQHAWHPFPRTATGWQALLPDSVQRRIIVEGEQYLHQPFASLPATSYLEFKRNGNRVHFEAVSFYKRKQLFALVLAESIEQKGRFTDDIVNGVWSVCEKTYWGLPAHYYLQKAGLDLPDVEDPAVDLFASETAEVLALADYLTGSQLDSISPLIRKRIYYEVNRRILEPLEKTAIPYAFLGPSRKDAPVNNWCPWVVSNWMISLLLLEKDQQRRVRELVHGMKLLDNYINGLGNDGAVDEGPSYWGGGAGRLFDALRMLDDATSGKVNIYREPVMQKLGAYIQQMHIAGSYFINIADASPVLNIDGLLVYRVGKAIGNKRLQNFGSWAYGKIDDHSLYDKDFSKPRILWNLIVLKECMAGNAVLPSREDAWFNDLQLMAGASAKGLFLASHAGHNGESHNHNDVGDFIVYARGEPVIVDIGFGTYTATTFSKDRYTLWYLNSAHHNVPLINGHQQGAGAVFGARNVHYTNSNGAMALQMDLAGAYPEETGVQHWVRTVLLDKNAGEITITDNYQLLKREAPLTQTLMTVSPAELTKPGQIVFSVAAGTKVLLEYDAGKWQVQQESMSTSQPDEKRVADNWGHRPIYRLLLTNKTPEKKGSFRYRIRQL